MTTSISARRVVTPDRITGPATVIVDGGRITAVEPAPVERTPERTLVPGFLDLQVNGIGDHDVGSVDADWDALDDALVRQGVTTWCPTLTSRPLDEYPGALDRISEASARSGNRPHLAGAHLEGPFLAPEFAGAHPTRHLVPIDLEWLATLPGIVRLITLAPELADAVRAVEALVERGTVVALGHSDATPTDVGAAVDAGASLVTHLFNAMPPLHHRRPGLVGAALADERLTVSLIADLVHVAPEVLQLAFSSKGPANTVLVTDSSAAGSTRFDGVIEVRCGAPRLPDGTIAGSVLTMDRAVANVVRHTSVPLEMAVAAASTNPARVLGLSDRGRVEPGARADLVALDDDFAVEAVWVGGEQLSG